MLAFGKGHRVDARAIRAQPAEIFGERDEARPVAGAFRGEAQATIEIDGKIGGGAVLDQRNGEVPAHGRHYSGSPALPPMGFDPVAFRS